MGQKNQTLAQGIKSLSQDIDYVIQNIETMIRNHIKRKMILINKYTNNSGVITNVYVQEELDNIYFRVKELGWILHLIDGRDAEEYVVSVAKSFEQDAWSGILNQATIEWESQASINWEWGEHLWQSNKQEKNYKNY